MLLQHEVCRVDLKKDFLTLGRMETRQLVSSDPQV